MAPHRQPRNLRGRRTRDTLLTAARDLIETGGPQALTMAAAADRAGVSRRAVYLHFPSRTELLRALFTHVNETKDLASSIAPVWGAPDAAAALDEWARHLARYHPPLIPLGRAMQQAQHTDRDAAAHWELVLADWYRHCHRLVTWLAREGRLAAPWTVTTATDMLWTLMSLDVVEGLLARRHWSTEQLGEHLAALFRGAFVAGGAAGDGR